MQEQNFQRSPGGSRRLKIAVVMGGRSPEHEISMESGKAVLEALDEKLFRGRAVVIDMDGRWTLFPEGEMPSDPTDGTGGGASHHGTVYPDEAVRELREWGIDAAFLALHGPNGEDGTIQGFFHTLAIPFTASNVHGSVAGMDKRITKLILARHGVDTPPWCEISVREWGGRKEEIAGKIEADPGLPCFVKAMRSGSSVGIYQARDSGELTESIDKALEIDSLVLVEKAVTGRELTCVVLGNAGESLVPLPPVEIVPLRGADFFDYEAKYEPGGAEEICPADLEAPVTKRIQELSLIVHEQCGFSGFSRSDFIMNDEGIWLLESNTIPGLTPASILPKAARAAGMTLSALVTTVIGYALQSRREKEGAETGGDASWQPSE